MAYESIIQPLPRPRRTRGTAETAVTMVEWDDRYAASVNLEPLDDCSIGGAPTFELCDDVPGAAADNEFPDGVLPSSIPAHVRFGAFRTWAIEQAPLMCVNGEEAADGQGPLVESNSMVNLRARARTRLEHTSMSVAMSVLELRLIQVNGLGLPGIIAPSEVLPQLADAGRPSGAGVQRTIWTESGTLLRLMAQDLLTLEGYTWRTGRCDIVVGDDGFVGSPPNLFGPMAATSFPVWSTGPVGVSLSPIRFMEHAVEGKADDGQKDNFVRVVAERFGVVFFEPCMVEVVIGDWS